MTPEQREELKACPFCSGTTKMTKENLDERYGYANLVNIQCSTCGVAVSAHGDTSKPGYADNSTTEARATAAWNRRAQVEAQATEREKLLNIIASAYQIAGKHDAPARVLDVLADPLAATEEQVEAMLPYQVEALTVDAERWQFLVSIMESAKGSAHLTVNQHLAYYDECEPGEEVSLQWYPDTPIGSYKVEGSSITQVVDEARSEFSTPTIPAIPGTKEGA